MKPSDALETYTVATLSHLSAFLFTMKLNWRRCHSMYQEVYFTVYLIWIFQNKKGQVADG